MSWDFFSYSTSERSGIWSCDLRAYERPQKKIAWGGDKYIDRQIYRQTDIATTRKNQPKARFFENLERLYICMVVLMVGCLVGWSVETLGWHQAYSALWRCPNYPTFLWGGDICGHNWNIFKTNLCHILAISSTDLQYFLDVPGTYLGHFLTIYVPNLGHILGLDLSKIKLDFSLVRLDLSLIWLELSSIGLDEHRCDLICL